MTARPAQTILHVDMDAFYVGVELRRRPDLRGVPMYVGGAHRGVVLSASYEARQFGITSGMSSTKARRLCPRAVAVPPDFDTYTAVSHGVFAIFEAVTSTVEAMSIDEAFLDITGSARRLGSPIEIGEHIRATVADEQGIACSVGIGPNKFIAKLASKQAKPDGLVQVREHDVVSFLHPLPVEKIWGVGESTAAKLHRLGLTTVADIAYTPKATLHRALGNQGGLLFDLAWGRDTRPVIARPSERSIGSQETLGKDTDDAEFVRIEMLRLCDRTAARMREAGALGRTVVLALRFADFTELSRSVALRGPTDETGEIYAAALRLWNKLHLQRARIRRVGIRVEGLVDKEDAYQQPTLDTPDRGWREAEQAADAVVRKFGPHAVQRAVLARAPKQP